MSTALDMSLDDLIKTNKRPSRGSAGGAGGGSRGGRVRGFGPGPSRRFPNRAANRANPYSAGKPSWAANNKLFMDQMKGSGRAPSGMDTGTKLYISNLDYGVSNEDIKELFSELGDLKKYSINYDRSGRSKGTAEVVFSRRADALLAVKKYNNVQLDGKPMKIEIVGMVPPVIVSAPPSAMPRISNVVRSGQGRGGTAGQPRGGGGSRGRGFGRGRGRGRGRSGPISAEALDADLDKYHTEAMQTN